jgi:hypothetical protein
LPTFFEIDPDLRFDNPKLHEFVGYWRSKMKDGRLPGRADIDPLDLRAFLGDIFMLDVVGAPRRFRYRLIGTKIVARVGRDSTGKFQEEAYSGEQAAENNELYRLVCERKVPLRNYGIVNWVGREFLKYEIANLPLAEGWRDRRHHSWLHEHRSRRTLAVGQARKACFSVPE